MMKKNHNTKNKISRTLLYSKREQKRRTPKVFDCFDESTDERQYQDISFNIHRRYNVVINSMMRIPHCT